MPEMPLIHTGNAIAKIPHVFCDMDGVVADFVAGFSSLYKVSGEHEITAALASNDAWLKVGKKHPHIFAILPKMEDADVLVDGLLALHKQGKIQLAFLTAIPDSWHSDRTMREMGTRDKQSWVKRNLPQANNIQVYVCTRKQKADYAKQSFAETRIRPILIDDFGKNIFEWNHVHGVGILHTAATESLKALTSHLRGAYAK